MLRAAPPVRALPGHHALLRLICPALEVFRGSEAEIRHFLALLVVGRTVAHDAEIPVFASVRRGDVTDRDSVLHRIDGIPLVDRQKLLHAVVQAADAHDVPALPREGGKDQVIAAHKGGHGDPALVAVGPGVFVIRVQFVVRVVFQGGVVHHFRLYLPHSGLSGDILRQCSRQHGLHVDGAPLLQRFGLRQEFLHGRGFPLRILSLLENLEFSHSPVSLQTYSVFSISSPPLVCQSFFVFCMTNLE